MKLGDFFSKEAVVAELKATDRNGVIRELIASLESVDALEADQAEAVARAVIQRENQGSTGFGKGVAVPHAKHGGVKRMVATIGRTGAGIDFSALDRAPVFIVVLLLSPPGSPDGHLAAMESIFKHLQRDQFRRFLRQSETAEEITDLIDEADMSPS